MTAEWRDRAACAGVALRPGFDPERDPWYPPAERGQLDYTRGRGWCASCPVAAECGAAGMTEPDGMWGNLDPDERRGLAKARRGRPTRVLSDAREAERMAAYESGWSDAVIAGHVGCNERSIRDWRARRGLPANYRRGSRERVAG